MARVKIVRPDGSPSPYFWKDEKEAKKALKTVYKKTSDGVKRLRGVRYDLANNTFQKD
ncbi:MAG TPA: hypothetical protein VM198_04205 [Longimicrobiales bacterium]|jgi:hypothetical protein|nr:hypothetical protein [Longimicrobiales bacterium]